MKPRELKKGIYCIGAVDWDRRLFDCLIPLPDGTSYNSYLVKGSEQTVSTLRCTISCWITLMSLESRILTM